MVEAQGFLVCSETEVQHNCRPALPALDLAVVACVKSLMEEDKGVLVEEGVAILVEEAVDLTAVATITMVVLEEAHLLPTLPRGAASHQTSVLASQLLKTSNAAPPRAFTAPCPRLLPDAQPARRAATAASQRAPRAAQPVSWAHTAMSHRVQQHALPVLPAGTAQWRRAQPHPQPAPPAAPGFTSSAQLAMAAPLALTVPSRRARPAVPRAT